MLTLVPNMSLARTEFRVTFDPFARYVSVGFRVVIASWPYSHETPKQFKIRDLSTSDLNYVAKICPDNMLQNFYLEHCLSVG